MIVLGGDFLWLFVALFAALFVRRGHWPEEAIWAGHFWSFLPIFLLWVAIFFIIDLYHYKILQNLYRTLFSLFGGVLIATFLTAIFFYIFLPITVISPKVTLILVSVVSFTILGSWRGFCYLVFFRKIWRQNVLILTNDDGADRFPFGMVKSGGIEYDISVLPLNSFDIGQIVKEQKIDEIVVAFDYKKDYNLARDLVKIASSGVKILEWPLFYEKIYAKIPVAEIDHFWFLHHTDEAEKKGYERFKRFLDIFLSFFLLICFSILLPFLALSIKSSKGPIFYRQKRVGKNGKIFTLVKLRTMKEGAEENGAQWAEENDPRTTWFGRFLRRTRLDEIPQLWNILKGEMSLVGPRPERPEFTAALAEKIPFYNHRHIVRPGLTGHAQIVHPYAASIEDSLEKVAYDLYYIKNRSLFLYCKIILRTIKSILIFQGR